MCGCDPMCGWDPVCGFDSVIVANFHELDSWTLTTPPNLYATPTNQYSNQAVESEHNANYYSLYQLAREFPRVRVPRLPLKVADTGKLYVYLKFCSAKKYL